MRGGVAPGGKMSQQRALPDLRQIARIRESDWWARVQDEIIFMYLSGSRGTNTEFVYPATFSGFANNSFATPDSNHQVYGGVATSKATLASTDTMSTLPIDKAVAYAEMMGGGGPAYSEVPQIQKCNVSGKRIFLCIMDPYQKFNLRRNTTSMDWADIQKAVATAVGNSNAFFTDSLGTWNDVVLQSHQNVIRFTDYGASGTVTASRALFLGLQAGVVIFGDSGGMSHYGWHEEERDNGNQIVISSSCKWGFKKTTFNGNDFGVMAIDTAAARP